MPNLARRFAAAAWRHRYIHLLSIGTLAIATFVGAMTGNRPDVGVAAQFGFYIGLALLLGGAIAALFTLVRLAVVERHPSPFRPMIKGAMRFFANEQRWYNAINGVVAFIVFAAGFSVLKGGITYFAPFSWDQYLADLDVFLHFGRAPHEWLWWIADSPLLARLVNLVYNFWFVVLIGMMFTVSIAEKDSRLRHTYILSFMIVWLVGGFFVAMGFSSAGPCYFARLDLGDRFQPLMDTLAEADRSYSIWALSTQDILWNGYKGLRNGSLGISAFPSLHVATVTLVAIYASSRSRVFGLLAWIFALAILVGSVVLGWHYAVDGYGGALLAAVAWLCVSRILRRSTEIA